MNSFALSENPHYGWAIGADVPFVGLGQLAEVKSFVGLNNEDAAEWGRFDEFGNQFNHLLALVAVEIVGRRTKNDPRMLGSNRVAVDPVKRVGDYDLADVGHVERLGILANDLAGWQMTLDKRGAESTPTDRFEAKRSSTREKIDGVLALDCRAHQIENGLADTVFHWPSANIARIGQFSPSETTANNTRLLDCLGPNIVRASPFVGEITRVTTGPFF